MIGNKENREEIKELLQKIAKQNKEKYEHILHNTDCGDTEIFLGYYKYDYDSDEKYTMTFDIIYGYFIDVEDEYSSNTMWGDYFELSDTFEKDMERKLKEIKEKESQSIKKGEQTIKRLKKLVSE